MASFQSAGRTCKIIYGSCNLGLAKALDKIGLAASQNESYSAERLTFALESLEEAFKIRKELLGEAHIDTVDTLSNIAGVYLKLEKLQIAKQTFHDVLKRRLAIFDRMHPSVAVTAHTLAIIHMSLQEMDDALHFFHFAYDVFHSVGIPEHHPLLVGILNEVAALHKVSSHRVAL